MRIIIGKIIVLVLKIFIPIFYIGFLAAGIGCALVSALIEFDVFKGLFPKNMLLIPALIVFAFETSKVFLVFLHKQYKSGDYKSMDKFIFLALRNVLILISVVATLLFSFYNLHNPEFKSALGKKTEQISTDYGNRIQETKERYAQSIKEARTACKAEKDRIAMRYQADIDQWRARMKDEEKIKDQNGNFVGRRYKEFERQLDKTIATRDREVRNVDCGVNGLISEQKEEVQKLNNEREDKTLTAEKELKNSNLSANKFIGSALAVIWSPTEQEYPKSAYIICIGLLSLLLSIGLELIIWSVFTILSVNHGHLFSFGMERITLEEQYREAEKTVNNISKIKSDALKDRILKERASIESVLEQFGKTS